MTCTISALIAGQYEIITKAYYGNIQYSEIFRIKSLVSASSVFPVSTGLNGGRLITVTGFGFSEDTIIQVYQNGIPLCKFCFIHSIPSPTELLFFTPRSYNDGLAKIMVSHEYINTDIPLIDLTYETFSAQIIDLTPTNIEGFNGGEEMTLTSSNAGNCANLLVKIAIAKDPCASARHNCAASATCIPTTDGLDYSCQCPDKVVLNNNADVKYIGSGFDCFEYKRWVISVTGIFFHFFCKLRIKWQMIIGHLLIKIKKK